MRQPLRYGEGTTTAYKLVPNDFGFLSSQCRPIELTNIVLARRILRLRETQLQFSSNVDAPRCFRRGGKVHRMIYTPYDPSNFLSNLVTEMPLKDQY